MANTTKTSRFEMRLTEQQRATIERAAATRGLTLSHWAINNLMDDAHRDIREGNTIYLSDEAYDDFVKALDEPMSPQTAQLLNTPAVWDERA
ncbi:DUF1778 domain-containing protein [Bifidobacterium pullorum subsp. saeculare]|uniref:DUF1778 domain-containing protein n=1 Tax=Bifidobacterium pullorum subsp. saeculare TaxID=78257 RepID=A0A939B9B9_9BIFI|nr:DUF1778 domain-containing protein [Bifidobacterium pullorum]MBM6699363.1 DUF1778 domain-containing protein [Bifidobacterium pullorum subsp. saeculare]